MNPVFKGMLEDRESRKYIKYELPARPYEIQDGMECLGIREAEHMNFEITEYLEYQYLEPCIPPTAEGEELQKLNFLARRLGDLENWQKVTFEGMVKMEMAQKEEISLERLIDLSYSTGSCHVLREVKNDFQLGKFCVANGFITALEDIPEEAMKYLDYEKIGREYREEMGGVITEGGYVEKWEEPQISAGRDFNLSDPQYTVLLETRTKCVSLPMAEKELEFCLWDADGEYRCLDCAVPFLIKTIEEAGDIEEINRFAGMLEEVEKQGQMQVYKAVLQATKCRRIEQAEELGSNLEEEYVLFHEKGNPIEIARDWLSEQYPDDIELFSEEDLYHIGQRYMEKYPTIKTEYGYLQRYDLEPIQPLEEEPEAEIGPQL